MPTIIKKFKKITENKMNYESSKPNNLFIQLSLKETALSLSEFFLYYHSNGFNVRQPTDVGPNLAVYVLLYQRILLMSTLILAL